MTDHPIVKIQREVTAHVTTICELMRDEFAMHMEHRLAGNQDELPLRKDWGAKLRAAVESRDAACGKLFALMHAEFDIKPGWVDQLQPPDQVMLRVLHEKQNGEIYATAKVFGYMDGDAEWPQAVQALFPDLPVAEVVNHLPGMMEAGE